MSEEQLAELRRRHAAAAFEQYSQRGKRGPLQEDFEFKAIEYVGLLLDHIGAAPPSPPGESRGERK